MPVAADPGELRQAIYALGLSFGIGPNGAPGQSNTALKRVMEEVRRRYGCKLIAQCEIGDLLENPEMVVRKHRENNRRDTPKYLDTLEVLRQMCVYIERSGASSKSRHVVVVAHPDHWARCAAVVRAMGFIPLAPEGLETIPYDPQSTQWWTRKRALFILREYLIRGLLYVYLKFISIRCMSLT
jgi:hypothetical protein